MMPHWRMRGNCVLSLRQHLLLGCRRVGRHRRSKGGGINQPVGRAALQGRIRNERQNSQDWNKLHFAAVWSSDGNGNSFDGVCCRLNNLLNWATMSGCVSATFSFPTGRWPDCKARWSAQRAFPACQEDAGEPVSSRRRARPAGRQHHEIHDTGTGVGIVCRRATSARN